MFILENGVLGIENKERINTISEMSGLAVGPAVGYGIGSAVAGPIGAIAGAVAGNIIEKVFVWAEPLINAAEVQKVRQGNLSYTN